MLLSRCSTIFVTASRRYTESISRMGVPLKRVVEAMNNFADTSLAASWDNVGLLVEPTVPKNIQHVLLTNDLTENVMQEAIDLRADLIVSYHPPIFAPLKRLTNLNWKERIIAKCLEKQIAVYSPHTSFDSIKGGVNDWLANSFDIESSKPIEIGGNPENGMGRICQLRGKSITTSEAVNLVKRRTDLPHVRIARAIETDKPIKTVAVCAGSGSTVLKNVAADLYVTGEMPHHDVLDAVHNNIHVILTDHSNSERGFLKVFAGILAASLEDSVKVSTSKRDADPLTIV
ncbi:NIF3-like protein 1 isoform X2 [Venturia canescens]|uniref:NIF3-like protein 1 isoform X2 n=1 Tax=Venturia canescens TaxID=32260 RepID=UPI001C9C5D80|nr:NIF3-like protein 1 isoform X2 [Venturia canescens]XP_043272603.1 NIF3-like protein 1 isoform X2 [Venturia canescens]